ncbi:MAG TPA: PaeR7I family type II restriction endonuclease [Myxococcota bacterium]|nr:PaeR7I family type II restriction endonuclease [Myxococcota bacterium]
MTIQLLPSDFDDEAAAAIRLFWSGRVLADTKAEGSQGGTRDGVISGKNMDGFIDLVRYVATHCGLAGGEVYTNKGSVVLPGYFRATKNWDVLVVHKRRLIAVFEFKSQVGSFGNNFNNRSEEVIGAAADLWVAHHHGAYTDARGGGGHEPWLVHDADPLINPKIQHDPRPPFLAWLMLLEECAASLTPVSVSEPHFKVLPEFEGASYARRYQILCERLVERQLYGSAALVLSPREQGAARGAHRSLSEATSLRALFTEFASRVAAATSA